MPISPPPEVIELLAPKLSFYENVRAATQRIKDYQGHVQEPCVEVRFG